MGAPRHGIVASTMGEPVLLNKRLSLSHREESTEGLWNSQLCKTSSYYEVAKLLFETIDVNGDGLVSKQEFIDGICNAPKVDLTEVEASRLYDTLDHHHNGEGLKLETFVEVQYLNQYACS